MGRHVMFGKGREWQVEDDRHRSLHLGPGRGAAIGEYARQETSEFSDSYYAPGDDYPHAEVARIGGITSRGRGPQGYRRSEERLHEAICERLTDDPHIDASDIAVGVQGGRVTLTGSVDRKQTKWNVEDIVESISGVLEIDNRLRARIPVT
jgi:osmotically-inducible protein OsmY